ncbi:hypothetical protein D9M71_703750 [compost metagenome]
MQVLHHHQRVGAHALGHVQCNDAVRQTCTVGGMADDLAVLLHFGEGAVLNRHQGGSAQRLGDALDLVEAGAGEQGHRCVVHLGDSAGLQVGEGGGLAHAACSL